MAKAKTPMMEQYLAIKQQYPDAFLFYRLGDFYEMFYDDAVKGAQILELTLTTRNKNAKDPIPMCGVPHHAVQNYIDILVDEGYKVAICEQMEDPKLAKGMVKRQVTQLITPGTHLEQGAKVAKETNYLAGVICGQAEYGIAFVELSTGQIMSTTVDDLADVMNELVNHAVKEVVINDTATPALKQALAKRKIMQSLQQQLRTQASFSYAMQPIVKPLEKTTVQMLLSYLAVTQKRSLDHLQQVQPYESNQFVHLNHTAQVNLDLLTNARTKKKAGTLLWLLDQTKTAMGGRLLKEWIARPLIKQQAIIARQNAVKALIDNYFERSQLQDDLSGVYDLERLVGKIAFNTANPRDLVQLKNSLNKIPPLMHTLAEFPNDEFKQLLQQFDPVADVASLIEQAIVENPPLSLADGGVIKPGYNERLDQYNNASKNGKQWLAELEAKERQKTGINNLKIGYNRVFGYYIEVSKANLAKLPKDRYQRKQTLTNAERFITPELKEKERLILEAQSQATTLEHQLFDELKTTIKQATKRLQKLAKATARLDVLQSLATVAEDQQFVCPQFDDQAAVEIAGGWHPVVKLVLNDTEYIPNDLTMGKDCEVLLITGPNMSGKSTYMRQIALTVIMAQMGSFVPAVTAKLPIFDRIFTRIGAADDLISGQSTFMVEMSEANLALSHATHRSLLLFDELGRGTATYDGVALAQAIIEYVHNQLHAKTLFATHYHELTTLAKTLPRLQNVHVGAVEKDGQLIFLHQVKPGAADRSYGIHVAKLAGMPKLVIERADVILRQLEQSNSTQLSHTLTQTTNLSATEEKMPSAKIAQSLASQSLAIVQTSQEVTSQSVVIDQANQNMTSQSIVLDETSQRITSQSMGQELHANQAATVSTNEALSSGQLALFDVAQPAKNAGTNHSQDAVLKQLEELNLLDKTPLEVFNLVFSWQQKLHKK